LAASFFFKNLATLLCPAAMVVTTAPNNVADLQRHGHLAAADQRLAQHPERRLLRVQTQVPDPAQHLQDQGNLICPQL